MDKITLYFIAGLLVLAISLPALAETPVSGIVCGIWDPGGSPYLVEGDLNVPVDSLLLIKPGVWVIFQDDYEFVVNGKVIAGGTPDDSIYFTTNPGITWSGFTYMFNPDTSCFGYCLFENADTYPIGYGGVFELLESNAVVEHCTFQHNWANRGAAMYSLWGYVQFRYNVCWDNHVSFRGGAINFGNDTNSCVERCVFYDNSASSYGGAIYFWDDHGQVINCTLTQNSSPAVSSTNGSTSSFENCIFWENSMGNVYSATYCDIQGGWPGTGNINADPMFVDPGNNNFHLLPNSPCIDAGNPASPLDPDGTIADMGAYYFDQTGWQPGNLTVIAEPVNPPVIIPPEGGSFEFTVSVLCDETGYAIFDAWTEIILPNGVGIGPRFERYSIFIAAGDSLGRLVELYLPAWAMSGVYEYIENVGNYPDIVWASDSFTFEKLYGYDGGTTGQEAFLTLSGWDKSERIDLPYGDLANPGGGEELTISGSPNPFNPTTALSYKLQAASFVNLTVYDITGRQVAELINGWRDAGTHEVTFDGSHLASGVYLYRLEISLAGASSRSTTGKMVLLK